MALTATARRGIGAALVLASVFGAGFRARMMSKQVEEFFDPSRQRGPSQARVTIVEYSDFQCPACKVAEPPLKKILTLYGSDINFIFKHFPLEMIHKWARPAAIASECAARQGKFWEYHDLLYDNQAAWSNDTAQAKFAQYAKDLKLDERAFAACSTDPSVNGVIDRDAHEARQRWVGSTPTFFINKKRFVGAKQLSERGSRWIEKLIKK